MDSDAADVFLPKLFVSENEEWKESEIVFDRDLLQSFAKRPSFSIEMILLSAYAVFLARYANQSELFIHQSEKGTFHFSIELSDSFESVLEQTQSEGFCCTQKHANVCFRYQGKRKESAFDLCLDASDEAICLQGARSRFSAGSVFQMLENFYVLLKALLEDSTAPIGKHPCLGKTERLRLNQMSHGKKRVFPAGANIVTDFEAAVQRYGEGLAISFKEQRLSYLELNKRANQLAHHLRELGVKEGDYVGLSMYRSIDLIVSLIAILKAGGVCVSIDPSYPIERKGFMFEDTQFQILLTTEESAKEFSPSGVHVVCLDSEREKLNVYDVSHLGTPSSLAAVLYTSGTTGRPKGILLHQMGILRFVWDEHWFPIEPQDKVLQTSNVSFDALYLEVWGALLKGASLCVNPERKLSAEGLSAFLVREKITHALFTASVFNLLVEYHLGALQHLKWIASAGEAMSIPCAKKAFLSLPSCKVVNAYGPSEISVISTYYQVHNIEEIEHGVPIGRPILNTDIYILNPFLQQVPMGVVGELFMGGSGVSPGYLNLPDKTRSTFIQNPFGEGKIYRSGDLGRFLPNGQIEYVGRVDNQVKIAGHRIELDEIANVIEEYPKVVQAVVLLHEATKGDKRLIAYVERFAEAEITAFEVKQFLQARFPQSMVPHHIVVLDRMPLTLNGKVDRKALPKVETIERLLSASEEPVGEIEVELSQMWKTLLQIGAVGRKDHFFFLGGSSILAAKLIEKLKQQWGIHVPATLIFEEPILENYAKRIQELLQVDETTSHVTMADLFWIWRQKETRLDPRIASTPLQPPDIRQYKAPQHLFLSGCTGFMGAFMLQELLQNTSATIYCLLRSENQEKGLQRLQETIQRYRFADLKQKGRIQLILGDLGEPNLGLNAGVFDQLAGQLDSLFHVGALVNHTLPYELIKAPNVGGVQELLRLATHKKNKPFHFVSTVDVFEMDRSRVIDESNDMEKERVLQTGYAQSKWIAEQLVNLARKKGLIASIYRMGRINSHSQSGAANEEDFFWKMVQASLFLKKAPDIEYQEGFASVDFCCQAIRKISENPDLMNQNYHIVNPVQVSYRDLFRQIQEMGYPLEMVPYPVWLQELANTAATTDNTSLQRSSVLFSSFDPNQIGSFLQFTPFRLQRALQQAPIAFPPFDKELLKRTIDFFISSKKWNL